MSFGDVSKDRSSCLTLSKANHESARHGLKTRFQVDDSYCKTGVKIATLVFSSRAATL